MKYKPKKEIDGVVYYQCNKCKEWFPIEGFYKDKRRSLGITSSCKKCHCKTTVETINKAHKNEANRLYMRRDTWYTLKDGEFVEVTEQVNE